MKESSAVICPICGGPTHINRDTGDFTCDHCGKIIVRSMKNNNWLPGIFDASFTASFDVEAALSPDVKSIMHDCELRGFEKINNSNYAMYKWPHMPDNWTKPDDVEVPEDFSPIIKLTKSTHPSPSSIRNAKAKIELLEELFPHPDGPWDAVKKSRPNSARNRKKQQEISRQNAQDVSNPEAVQRAEQSGQAAQERIERMRAENATPVIDTGLGTDTEETPKPKKIKPIIPVISEERVPPPRNATDEEFAEYNRKRLLLMNAEGRQQLMDEGCVGDVVPNFRDYSKTNQEKYCGTPTGILRHTSKNGVPRCDYCRIFDYYRQRKDRPNLTDRMYAKVQKAFDNVLSETPDTARNKPAYARIMALIKNKTQTADAPDDTTNITTAMAMGEVRSVIGHNNYIKPWYN